MLILIDHANVDSIAKTLEYLPIDGVTTNPPILYREGKEPLEVLHQIKVTATGIHSSMQGFMAAKAGARYVAPYVNRMDNYGIDGVRVASEIHRTLRSYDLQADVLAASFKNSEQVLELVRQGVGAITAAPDVLAALIKNPATDAAIADQNRDFGFLVGERRTWLDLIKEK